MKSALKITAALLTASVFMAGCTSDKYPAPQAVKHASPITDREVLDFSAVDSSGYREAAFNGYMRFAIDMYAMEASGTDENLMISPASIFLALGMTSAGAAGDTLTQMTDVLTPGATPEELQAFGGYYNRTLNEGSEVVLHSANSIWFNETKTDSVYQDYLDFVTETYGAQIGMVTMDRDGEEIINSWVKDQTNGMIDGILPPGSLTNRDMAVLVNAVAFEASWAAGTLDCNRHLTFHNADGSESDIDMLRTDARYYLSNEDAYGCLINYAGNQYAFMAIMPVDPSVDANTFASDLTVEEYQDLWLNREYRDTDAVIVNLPEFSCDYDTELRPQLQAMGMTAPFDEYYADFANMTEEQLSITGVIHVTHIEVDHQGTRASAATAVQATTAAAAPDNPMILTFDRPFVYAIVDTQTGLPLFIGTVNYL